MAKKVNNLLYTLSLCCFTLFAAGPAGAVIISVPAAPDFDVPDPEVNAFCSLLGFPENSFGCQEVLTTDITFDPYDGPGDLQSIEFAFTGSSEGQVAWENLAATTGTTGGIMDAMVGWYICEQGVACSPFSNTDRPLFGIASEPTGISVGTLDEFDGTVDGTGVSGSNSTVFIDPNFNWSHTIQLADHTDPNDPLSSFFTGTDPITLALRPGDLSERGSVTFTSTCPTSNDRCRTAVAPENDFRMSGLLSITYNVDVEATAIPAPATLLLIASVLPLLLFGCYSQARCISNG